MKNKVLTWDEYFMSIALVAGLRSKDPNTQVGACIANADNHIIGTGYNGWPKDIPHDTFSWQREGRLLETKYPYVVHAELNAILNSIRRLDGCRIYVPLFPCNECAKAIIQAGIREVIYMEDKYFDQDAFKASRTLFLTAGVKMRNLPVTDRWKSISIIDGRTAIERNVASLVKTIPYADGSGYVDPWMLKYGFPVSVGVKVRVSETSPHYGKYHGEYFIVGVDIKEGAAETLVTNIYINEKLTSTCLNDDFYPDDLVPVR